MDEEVRAAAARAAAAGPALRARPLPDRIETVGTVLQSLYEDARAGRLTERLAAATGFAPATLERGLVLALEEWDRAALARLAEAELAGPLPDPPAWTAVILAGAIPSPSMLAVLAPLVVGSPVVAKTGRHDRETPRLVAERLAATDPEMAAALEIVDVRGDDARALDQLCMAPCVTASGSDETIAALSARCGPGSRLVGYGHRVSIAVLGPELTTDTAARAAALAGLALDTALWDQLGCCSPVAAYVLGGRHAADALFEELANEFAKTEAELPRGVVPLEARVHTRQERDEGELRAASGERVRVLTGDTWTLVLEPDARWRPSPLHRFLRLHPIDAPADLHAALAPLGGRLSSVALAGLGPARAEVAEIAARHGASRTCDPGRLQAPPLSWPRDGHAPLRSTAASC